MTTPDEEITGYGGQPKTGPNSTSNTTGSNYSNSSSNGNQSANVNQGSTTGSSSTGHTTEEAKAKAKDVAEQVKSQGKSQLEGYRETAADGIERVAQSAKAAAHGLEGDDRLGLSGYVSDMAENMVHFSESLRGKSVDELFQDVNRLARNNPALFITGSIALGFGLTRFARASSKRAAQHDYDRHDSSSSFAGATSSHDSSQRDLNDRLSTGQPGTVGSVSNASGASSGSRPTSGSASGMGTGIGTGSGTGVGTGLSGSSSSTTGANTSNGLGIGSNPSSGSGSTSSRDGKGTNGGLFP